MDFLESGAVGGFPVQWLAMAVSPQPAALPVVSHSRGARLFDPALPLHVGVYDHRPETMGWHDHDFWEIAMVISGKGWHRTLEHQRRMRPGDLYLLPPGVPHVYVVESRHRVINLMFDPAWMRRAYGSAGAAEGVPAPIRSSHPSFRALVPSAALFLRRLLAEMERECRERALGHATVLELKFRELWIHLARWEREAAAIPLPGRDPAGSDHVRRVRGHILANSTDPHRLEDLAKLVGVNPSYLSRLFHRETGYTLFQFLAEVRVEKACRLLRETDRPIAELALEVG
ncbi:MAG: AraC family ligand binding domain-containing protein, partial [Spirochaetes bacterium]|nr:AraC family ligand binding domain-containing protein [Spirochaetota bacterium]